MRESLQEELDSLLREKEAIGRHPHLHVRQKRYALYYVLLREDTVRAALEHAQRQSTRLPEEPEP